MPQATSLLALISQAILLSAVSGCSFFPINPVGAWIGGFTYGWSNPLITTEQDGILVSNLVVYEDDNVYDTGIVINATSGSVRQRTEDDRFTLTQDANETTHITDGYSLEIDVATDKQTAVAKLESSNGSLFEFTLEAPASPGFLPWSSDFYNFFVSPKLNKAYLAYKHAESEDHYYFRFTHYAVLDLSAAANNSTTPLQMEDFPISYAYAWSDYLPAVLYEDLQVFSIWTGDSCYGRYHFHYNETHLTLAEGMEYHTFTRSIDYQDSVREHSYYSLTQHTEEVEEVDTDTMAPTDYWYYADWMVVNYTLQERTLVTGDILGEVMLNMDDVQAIANDLIVGSNATTSSTTDRQFLRNSVKRAKDKTSQDLATIHIQTSLEFDFFQGQGEQPSNDDLGSLIAGTQEFFREMFRNIESDSNFVDFTMSNVKPRQEDPNNSDQFTLDFVSNIMQEGDSLTAHKAADIMAGADFKHYIGHFLRSSPSSAFHSTFKVFFKGIGQS